MAVIIDLPDISGWSEVTFDPVIVRTLDRMEGRRTEGQRIGFGWWTAKFTPGRLDWIDMGKMDAFMMRAADGCVFRGYDVFRPRPIRHDTGVPLSGIRASGGAFDGTATLVAIVNSSSVRVSGLPAHFTFSRGDYVEFRQGAQSSLHRVVLDVTADAAGIVTITFEYGLDTGSFTTAAAVRFEKPSCLMQITPGSYDGKKGWQSRRPSFAAEEVFPE